MRKRIAAVTRLRDSRNGNPVYHVEFDDGTAASTVKDGPIGGYAASSEWLGADVDIDWDGDRILGWRNAQVH
jgi:hypothetical protein